MNRKQRASYGAILLLGLLSLGGCASKTYVPHPGSANTFDSQAYDTVLIAHTVIEDTKTQLANNAFQPAVAAAVKTALNDLITAYNVADTSYQAYHAAALAGTATATQQASLQAQLNSVTAATTNLTSVKGN